MTSYTLETAPDTHKRVLLGENILIPTTEVDPLNRFEPRVVNLKLPPTYTYTVHKDHQCMDDPDYDDDCLSVVVEFTTNLLLSHEEAFQVAEEIDEWEEEEDYISSAEEEYMVELDYEGIYYELTSHLTVCNGVIRPENYTLPELDLIQEVIDKNPDSNDLWIKEDGVYLDGEMIISHRLVCKHNDQAYLLKNNSVRLAA